VTTTVPQTTAFQATTPTTTTTVPQTSTVRTYQSTRLPGIKRLELTGGCVEVPRALTEELRDHPAGSTSTSTITRTRRGHKGPAPPQRR
jgi:hypothetical protein